MVTDPAPNGKVSLNGGSTGALRLVHRGVRVGEQRLEPELLARRRGRDADRETDAELGTSRGDRAGRDRLLDATRNVESVLEPRLGQDDDELAAAQPPAEVVVAKLRVQGVGDRDERRVAGEMPVSVVDRPQPVDVADDHRE